MLLGAAAWLQVADRGLRVPPRAAHVMAVILSATAGSPDGGPALLEALGAVIATAVICVWIATPGDSWGLTGTRVLAEERSPEPAREPEHGNSRQREIYTPPAPKAYPPLAYGRPGARRTVTEIAEAMSAPPILPHEDGLQPMVPAPRRSRR
jgi:hypothetical protein